MKKIILLGLAFVLGSCASEDIFQDLGANVASPVGLVVDSTNRRLYFNNSNSEVSYDAEQGSFQTLDITDPQNPTLLQTLATDSFSGETVIDVGTDRAFVVNRLSENSTITEDKLFTISLSGGTLEETTLVDLNPFALACCFPANRMLVSTSEGVLHHVDLSTSPLTVHDLNLLRELSDGSTLTKAELNDIVIIGQQAFLSRVRGGILVINLNELDDSSVNPVDYFISDITTPRGMAANGTSLLVTDEDVVNGTLTSRVLILDTSSLTALTDNQTVTVKDKDDDALVTATITVGRDPEQVVVAGTQAFVTNLDDDTVSVIDLGTNAVTNTITVGDKPFEMAVDSPGGTPTTLYIGNLASNNISILDISSLTVAATYP